ncbi:hypothetical protein RvY_06110 [Ramazzottius varieornatus]|uniref:RNA-directed DNA polymerase n=1 Tax=Ramazzottius varieornatus TaxID=947166 RepID=A0A1D1V0Z0_RAMVA|nr:hypothetical protein RvY_06110 [Ramazzottius varieornatus]
MGYRENQLRLQLVVPKVHRTDILREAHDNSNHLGITQAFERLFTNYYWPNLLNDAATYCASCQSCQLKKSPNQRPIGQLQPPCRRTIPDRRHRLPRRNRYLLVAVDYRTKWIETRAIRAHDSTASAHFFWQPIVLRHGASKVFVSDKGSQFLSGQMQEVLKLPGTEHRTTTAYNPRCNGLTESYNGVISEEIPHYLSKDHRDWDRLLSSTHSPSTSATRKQRSIPRSNSSMDVN